MEISGESLALIVIIAIMIFLLGGIVYAISSKNFRKGNSTHSVAIFGATSQFQNLEEKAATEHILEVQSNKKMKEEESGDPDSKE